MAWSSACCCAFSDAPDPYAQAAIPAVNRAEAASSTCSAQGTLPHRHYVCKVPFGASLTHANPCSGFGVWVDSLWGNPI